MSGDNTARNADLAFAKSIALTRANAAAKRRWPLGLSLLAAATVSALLWVGIFWLGGQLLSG